MGIRESVSRSPKSAPIIGVGIAVVAALGFAFMQLEGRSDGGLMPGADKAWYTDDDGRTWFADDAGRISPFDHNDKQAYRCGVWTCDGGKTKFVSHMERLKPQRMKSSQAGGSGGANKAPDFVLPAADMEVKLPLTGDRGWTDYGLPAGQKIRTPQPPAGQSNPVVVEPK